MNHSLKAKRATGMTTVHYKGFQGSVELEDDRLIIQILHIEDLITAEIDSAAHARPALAELVEDYLATCAELGKEPCRPKRGATP
jgi:predicted HicB family RNase H-like nuclease